MHASSIRHSELMHASRGDAHGATICRKRQELLSMHLGQRQLESINAICCYHHAARTLCRYLLRDVMASMLRAKWKKWDILDTAIEREGWKLLLLLRLSPMVPYNLLNIAMATTKMHFATFTVVSAFGRILHLMLNPVPLC